MLKVSGNIKVEQVIISDIKVDVVRKDIKNIHLAVYPPAGRVRIAVPEHVNEDSIHLLLVSKLVWIKRQQRKFEGQERITPREYKNRESHYFQGRRYLLRIHEEDSPPKVLLQNKTYIDMYVRPGTPLLKKHELMNEWYRATLKEEIPAFVNKWENKIGVRVNQWQVKQMKTKWGSCNTEKGRIWLNLELAKKPLQCLEYIIVHEMIHLLERHHNDKFLHHMNTYLPNWKQLKAELNKLPVSHADWGY